MNAAQIAGISVGLVGLAQFWISLALNTREVTVVGLVIALVGDALTLGGTLA